MASKEEIEEAAQLRFLALQSMVKRMRHTDSDNRVDEIDTGSNYDDDPDIKLLRAAALKTITNKNNVSPLSNKGDKYEKCLLSDERKRVMSNQECASNKYLKPNNSNLADDKKSIFKNGNSKNDRREKEQFCSDTSVAESSNQSAVAVTREEITRVVRNGCIQLSNLDSEKVDETMILHITFSSSDDSSSDSPNEIVEKYKKKEKEIEFEKTTNAKGKCFE